MERELLDVKEAAARLRLKPTTIRAWILNRKIPFVKIGGRVLIRANRRGCTDSGQSGASEGSEDRLTCHDAPRP
jgi:excisionase family DNA binding protein